MTMTAAILAALALQGVALDPPVEAEAAEVEQPTRSGPWNDMYGEPQHPGATYRVRLFVHAAQACLHFAGEEPYDAERAEFLEGLGLSDTGLSRVIRAGYELLHLITFFTVGPKETRAWTVAGAATASDAAGRRHTDFQKGFIRAETISYADYVEHGGEQGAREAGRMRQEGREYKVQDGDVMLFRFNV